MIVKTLNSTYEVDFAESRVRRLEGVNPSALARAYGTQDGDWQTFVEAKRYYREPEGGYDGTFVWFFVLNDGGYLRTSLVQEEIE